LRTYSPAADNLTHDRVERETVSSVNVLVSGQPPEYRLPEQPLEPADGVLAAAGAAQRCRRQIGQPELPKGPSGKVQRARLPEMLAREPDRDL